MKRKRTAVTVVAICLCAMFFCTTRAQAEEITPSTFEVEEESSIVLQVGRSKITPYVYRDGRVEQEGEIREKIVTYYITKRGETLESIATKLKVSPKELMAENENIPLEDGTYAVRTYLKLPKVDWSKVSTKVYYYVEKGDCLSMVSEHFEIGISEIVSCNNQEGEVVVSSEGGYTKDLTKKEPCKGEDIYDMFFIKKTMWLMDNPANSIWRISPEITDENIIYAGDFIRIK